MTWSSPIASSLVAWTAAAVAALTITAYIIRMRRRRFEVPFSTLWKRVLEQRDANALWKQLKRLLSLLLLLAILGLILAAALGPTLGGRDERARSVVILLDASASMRSVDGDPDRPGLTRMQRARERAKELIDSMGGSDQCMVMRVDGQATPLSRFDSDKPLLRRIVDGVEPADTPSDLPRALSAAADALRGRQNPLIVVVSDGAYSEQQRDLVEWDAATAEAAPPGDGPQPAAGGGSDGGDRDDDPATAARKRSFAAKQLAKVDLSGIDVTYLGVGSRAENVGIVAFNVRRYIANKAAYEVFIEVQNFGTEPARRQLALYNGETAIEVKPLELAPGQRVREIYRQLPGGDSRLRASLRPVDGPGGSDPFPLDDQAWALLPARKKQSVLLVTTDNLYLEGAMLVYDNIEVYKATPEEFHAAPGEVVKNADTGKPYDVVVFDDFTPLASEVPPPPINLIYFNPAGPDSPFPIRSTVARPRVTETAEDHPVMRWVQLSDVNFDKASVFALDRSKSQAWLALYVRDAIAAAGRADGRKVLAFGFSLTGTDLMLRVAFPLLLVNSLDWFAGDDADLVTTYSTGQRFRIPLDGLMGVREVTVIDPTGARSPAPVVEGMATFYGRRVGVHQIIAYDPADPAPPAGAGGPNDKRVPIASLELAANLGSTTESRIAPAEDLVLAGRPLPAPPAFAVSARRDLWVYIVLAVLALLGLEWITYHRRITV